MSQNHSHHHKNGYKGHLSPFIKHSPLSTALIAWTRMGTHMAILAAFVGTSLLVYLGWAMWPTNREVWWQWATDRAIAVGLPEQTMSIGIRWSIAILLAVNTFLAFRWIAFYWVGFSGRESWVIFFSVGLGIASMVVIGIVVAWFLKNASSWEHITESAMYWLQYLPHLISTILGIKVLCGIASVLTLTKSKLVSDHTVARILCLWLVVAAGLGITCWLLIPDPRATILWCLAASIIATPLSSIMIAPVSMYLDRVR